MKAILTPLYLLLCLLTSTLVIACSSVPIATASEDAVAENFGPIANKSVVYVYQLESGGGFEMIIDGKEAGIMGARAYFRFELEPGEHTISSRWGGEREIFIHKSTFAAGKTYYIEHSWHLRFLAPPHATFDERSESEGTAAIGKCKLLKNLF